MILGIASFCYTPSVSGHDILSHCVLQLCSLYMYIKLLSTLHYSLLLYSQHKVKYYSYCCFVDEEQKHTGTGLSVASESASLDKKHSFFSVLLFKEN